MSQTVGHAGAGAAHLVPRSVGREGPFGEVCVGLSGSSSLYTSLPGKFKVVFQFFLQNLVLSLKKQSGVLYQLSRDARGQHAAQQLYLTFTLSGKENVFRVLVASVFTHWDYSDEARDVLLLTLSGDVLY